MKIGYLGCGSWGFCLATHLARKGYDVTIWTQNPTLCKQLNAGLPHPRFQGVTPPQNLRCTTNIQEALEKKDLLVESVTASAFREVMNQIKILSSPLVITSKGIEKESLLILSEVAIDVFGEEAKNHIGYLSGPSYAQEVIHSLPTSVVAAAYNPKTATKIQKAFSTPTFRVYPNSDVKGVALGGALKNIIAIACGIADGMGFGMSARAALITRGLHEIRKLALAMGCYQETINGLSGMGDIYLTCSSTMSRNFSFGQLLAKGENIEEAKGHIDMVVEGAYTCQAALKLAKKYKTPLPISSGIYRILYEGLKPKDAVKELMMREIKEEHL